MAKQKSNNTLNLTNKSNQNHTPECGKALTNKATHQIAGKHKIKP